MDLTTCPLTSFSSKNGLLAIEDIIILEAVAAFMCFTEESIEKDYERVLLHDLVVNFVLCFDYYYQYLTLT